MAFTHTQTRERFVVTCDELAIGFSRDDGGLRTLRRAGGPELAGHGDARPSLDVALRDRGWLGERTLVRYLSHQVEEHADGVEIKVVIGLGPLIVEDRYVVTGTLVTRRLRVRNIGEDEVALVGVRLALPWIVVGPDARFEAPGNSVRPRVAAEVAADQRPGVLPRRFFAPGLRGGSAFERAPISAAGLLALHEPVGGETLLCWYGGGAEPALPEVSGNGAAVTVGHQVEIAARLRPDDAVEAGTQSVLLLRADWPEALAAYHAATPPRAPAATPGWASDAVLYECHPAQFGGFRGTAAELPRLAALGVDTLCLLPIWERGAPTEQPWDGSPDARSPYIVADYERLDGSLGTPEDLRGLVAEAHRHGLRVIVDLPLLGCTPDAPLVAANPTWFCRDELGFPTSSPVAVPLASFDWAAQPLRDYIAGRGAALVRDYALDGLRVTPPRGSPSSWVAGLAYHASAGALGYLALIERLRGEIRAANPEAALLGALGGPALAALQDFSVDELPHHMFFHLGLGRLTPAELGAWLADHCAVQPPNAVRVCFTESHHTHQLNPLADGMRGSRISRMLLAGMILCGFVPMLRAGQEHADEGFVGHLLAARAGSTALRRGDTHYNGITCDAAQVFTVLRRAGDEQVLGLLNNSPHRRTVTLRLPLDELELADGEVMLYDLLRRRAPECHGRAACTRADLEALQVTLEPYEAACLALQPAPRSPDALVDAAEHPAHV